MVSTPTKRRLATALQTDHNTLSVSIGHIKPVLPRVKRRWKRDYGQEIHLVTAALSHKILQVVSWCVVAWFSSGRVWWRTEQWSPTFIQALINHTDISCDWHAGRPINQWGYVAFHWTGELIITRWQSQVHDLQMERKFFHGRQFRHHDDIGYGT